MTKHIFYFPSSYASVIHSFVGCLGLLFPLYIGVILHPRELLATHCGPNHYEFWPSISTTIGDMMPERQIWRTTLLVTFPFRVISSITLFYAFWTKGTSGVLDLKRFAFKPLSLLRSSSFVACAMLWVDLWRWLAAFVWTMVVSAEIHDVHNFGFLCFIVMSVSYHVACTTLVWRNRSNSAIYPSHRDAQLSLMSKMVFLVGQFLCAAGVIIFYIRHRATCAPGSYSLANMCEWNFALCNLLFDSTVWFDIQNEGVWLSGSPSFYQQLFSSSGQNQSAMTDAHPAMPTESEGEKAVESHRVKVSYSGADDVEKPLFRGSDVIVHTFSIRSPPSDTLMWLCDTFWAYQYFGSVMHCIQHMYFQPLVSMSVTPEIIAGLSNASPLLLAFPVFRRYLCRDIPFIKKLLPRSVPTSVPMYVLFYFLTTLSHLQQLVTQNPGRKIVVTGVGPFFLYLAFFSRFLYPTSLRSEREEMQESRRIVYTMPLGLMFSMIMRMLYLSLDPLYVIPFYGCVVGIGLGMFFTITIFRHAVFHEVEDPETTADSDASPRFTGGQAGKTPNTYMLVVNAYRGTSSLWTGILHGGLYFFSLMFLTSASIIPRLVAVEPLPGGILVILSFLGGVLVSPSLLPICARVAEAKSRSIRTALLRVLSCSSGTLYVFFLFLGTLLLLYGTRQTNFTLTSVKYDYHQPNVSVKDWTAQDTFAGSKHLAFFGGLLMIFCVGAGYPVMLEMTWVHKRYRHLQSKSNERLSLFNRIRVASTFEFLSFGVHSFFIIAFAFSIAYPFVPGGALFREKTRSTILLLVSLIAFIPWMILRRMREVNIDVPALTAFAQRSLPLRMVIWVLFILLLVLSVRSFRQPEVVGFPVGDVEFANKYRPYILCVQDRILEVRKVRNGLTDDTLSWPERNFIKDRVSDMLNNLRNDVVNNGCYHHSSVQGELPHLTQQELEKVYEVGKALASVKGGIWTVHFALDNRNKDSLTRLVDALKEQEVSVVGFLESDASHVHNGNRDLAEYVGYHLGFPYVDNGPTPLDNTFGCAMISRYPILKVHRYVIPSPLGELACMIHAQLDVMGVHMETYVAHFGNTEHDADGLLQSQFLGQVVKQNPGPSMFLGYVVTYPGNPVRYGEYSDPKKPGYLRDSAHHIYTKKAWKRLTERGGYDEPPTEEKEVPQSEQTDFNIEAKIPVAKYLEEGVEVDKSFRRTPGGLAQRTFYFNDTNRYSHDHPRFEFLDRYCQYTFFKTGREVDELPEYAGKVQSSYAAELFDWRRFTGNSAYQLLSDTELQVIELKFAPREQ